MNTIRTDIRGLSIMMLLLSLLSLSGFTGVVPCRGSGETQTELIMARKPGPRAAYVRQLNPGPSDPISKLLVFDALNVRRNWDRLYRIRAEVQTVRIHCFDQPTYGTLHMKRITDPGDQVPDPLLRG